MENKDTQSGLTSNLTRHFTDSSNPKKLFLIILVSSVVLGTLSGYLLSTKGSGDTGGSLNITNSAPKSAQTDTRTFRDFAEGTIKAKPQPKDPTTYTEGTHLLERSGAVSVALTSSVVDLSQYEGKKVKVFGETQKALKEGWLMDVGKIEEIE